MANARVDSSLIISSRLRSQSTTDSTPIMDSEQFNLFFSSALLDTQCSANLRKALLPMFSDFTDQLAEYKRSNDQLFSQLKEKEEHIVILQNKCEYLECKIDDMEQWQRKGSMRMQGVIDSPTESTDILDKKILEMCQNIEVDPPLELSEIEIAHRLPHPRSLLQRLAQEEADANGLPLGTLPDGKKTSNLMEMIPPHKVPPRSVIIKFTSRRVKSKVMAARKKLRTKLTDTNKYPNPVYFQDDLTAPRAKLAYTGRQLKAKKLIEDSWVFDSKVLIKDLQGRIKNITKMKELAIYDPSLKPTGAGWTI